MAVAAYYADSQVYRLDLAEATIVDPAGTCFAGIGSQLRQLKDPEGAPVGAQVFCLLSHWPDPGGR